ncbi:uncharacterized protein FYW61_016591 [Anableps anableps]
MLTLSYSRWIFLLSLAALMFISESEGSTFRGIPCWETCFVVRKQHIQTCYEQQLRHDCKTHGFLVTNHRGQKLCIKGDTIWIKDRIAKGQIKCPPDISPPM